ncbi:MAG: excinuclease ABC subunit UvrB [Alphaproteobacteria bacterium]|nr:excinuclease ABC subunit UvrB [Alphaproteobacteria bacterium]
MGIFKLQSDFQPAGDQPQAIKLLGEGVVANLRNQTLLGVTGSGKTFTMAHVIAQTEKPTLVLAHNKTLAAQLYAEMRDFFPDNHVEYFVSYYDYYQPEAYVPRTDTFIEKESTINEQINRMRHSATRAILEHRDVIIVASVSCIYGIGDRETYSKMVIDVEKGMQLKQQSFIKQAVELQYNRNEIDFSRGRFRVRGDNIEIFPAHLEDCAWRISFFGDEVEQIKAFDPLTGVNIESPDHIRLYANSHYATPRPSIYKAIDNIKEELQIQLQKLHDNNKLLEAQRLEQRTVFDIEMLQTTGMCQGIENYSRFLSGRKQGEAPPTLFEYFPEDALLFVDESHVMIPQLGAMYKGDFSRKSTLSEYGFRLPSCLDNRPLKFEEWDNNRPQTIFVSATPRQWELDLSDGHVVEQIVRPTGLLDPICEIRPIAGQVDDVIDQCRKTIEKGGRALITTLTKKFSEELTEYMDEAGLKVRYLHSDIDTLERIQIIRDLRQGVFDILVGINLLREGLDIPECALVAILDADKEGFLRSKTSLVQTIGRAARHIDGLVVLYADHMTDSLTYALDETTRRREKQQQYNEANNITPQSIKRAVHDMPYLKESQQDILIATHQDQRLMFDSIALKQYLPKLEQSMKQTADELDFEQATIMRDELKKLRYKDLEMPLSACAIDYDLAVKILTKKKKR